MSAPEEPVGSDSPVQGAPDGARDLLAGAGRDGSPKLGTFLKMRLATLAEGEDPEGSLVIGVSAPIDAEQRAALEAIGLRLRTSGGRVLTATGPLRAAERAAQLEFVDRVGLPQQLDPEPDIP